MTEQDLFILALIGMLGTFALVFSECINPVATEAAEQGREV